MTSLLVCLLMFQTKVATLQFTLSHISICAISVYVIVMYFHNPESARKILRTLLRKGNGRHGKLAIDVSDSS